MTNFFNIEMFDMMIRSILLSMWDKMRNGGE